MSIVGSKRTKLPLTSLVGARTKEMIYISFRLAVTHCGSLSINSPLLPFCLLSLVVVLLYLAQIKRCKWYDKLSLTSFWVNSLERWLLITLFCSRLFGSAWFNLYLSLLIRLTSSRLDFVHFFLTWFNRYECYDKLFLTPLILNRLTRGLQFPSPRCDSAYVKSHPFRLMLLIADCLCS